MQVVLPFRLNAYPDEVIGSWLARLKLHNDCGPWRRLLGVTGFGRTLQCAPFERLDWSPKYERLLAALGISYEQAVLSLRPHHTGWPSAQAKTRR